MYEKRTLKNGLRIVYEYIPYVRSVSMGIWVGTGSRYEKACENGSAHFIEHMLFKGTSSRTAAQIAEQSDAIGGLINAFTSRECTCFFGRVLDEDLTALSDILSDMFLHSLFDEQDIINERNVIFEEMDMYEDTPDDLVSERLISSVYKGSSLSRPVLGTKKTLSSITGDTLKKYMHSHYCADSIVISISGSFKESDIDYIEKLFSSVSSTGSNRFTPAVYKPTFTIRKKKIEQNHLCLGFPGIRSRSEERFPFLLMSTILGGGMSSRLFQKVREENGLCYTISSYTASSLEEGMFTIYTATNKDLENDALHLILEVINDFVENGITDDELACAKKQARSNLLMGLESTSTRMNRLGSSELLFGETPDINELCNKYESVTKTDISKIAEKYLNFDMLAFSAVGNVKSADYYRNIILGKF